MNKYPDLFSDVPRKCSSRMVFHGVEGKKKTETEEKGIFFLKVWFKKDYKLVKNMEKGRERKWGKRNSLPQSWNMSGTREKFAKTWRRKKKRKERKRNLLPQGWNISWVKTRGRKKKEQKIRKKGENEGKEIVFLNGENKEGRKKKKKSSKREEEREIKEKWSGKKKKRKRESEMNYPFFLCLLFYPFLLLK